MSQLLLPIATVNEISTIAHLADVIWHQHYPSIISESQISYMLGKMYSSDSLNEQMNVKGHVFHLIRLDNNDIGFISLCRISEDELFINKYYINQNKAGKGVGTHSFNELLKLYQPNIIKLTVNRQNYKSINFYFKNGFIIESVADFDIGNGYLMNDFIMVWKKKATLDSH